MNDSLSLSTLMAPMMAQFNPQSMLIAGDLAADVFQWSQDTRLQRLTTPFTQQQLSVISAVDMAVISDLTESLTVSAGQQWLGLLRNLYAPHVMLISNAEKAQQNGWQLRDFLAMGLVRYAGNHGGMQLFSYAIENYQPKRDWLNSRFWANPQNFDKYWW